MKYNNYSGIESKEKYTPKIKYDSILANDLKYIPKYKDTIESKITCCPRCGYISH